MGRIEHFNSTPKKARSSTFLKQKGYTLHESNNTVNKLTMQKDNMTKKPLCKMNLRANIFGND